MGKSPPHIWSVDAIVEHLRATLPGWWCRKEEPVRIGDLDVPEPDVAVVPGTRNDYRGRIPDATEVALLVEVADGSLPRDRGEKCAAYARAGIPLYWIINLVDRQVEVYSDPTAGEYQSVLLYKQEDEVPLLIRGNVVGQIRVSEVLP